MNTTASQTEQGGHVMHRDDEGSRMGMWLFLFTEVILFGGLFTVYAVYRYMHPQAFHAASDQLNLVFGAVNTVVLLTSSLTVALAISAMQMGKRKHALIFLGITILAALTFMVNKYFEWGAKIEHGLFPGTEHFFELSHGESQFFYLYYFMTGLHGLHVVVGAILLAIMGIGIAQRKITRDNYTFLENSGLYWHLVDVIWIFLFPLLYLIK
ncbi:MAG: cytochrome c oxidase subunit 3 family protein [Bacteroidales bacterium]|nr:cytochrome c oxidase subunit 3 family protein [Bacteroidales bacterium]